MWKEERENIVGVVNPLKYLHLDPLKILEDCTIDVQKDIIRLVLVIYHVQ